MARLGQLPSSITAIRGHWAETDIDWAFTTSITDGCPAVDQLTCPDLEVTRDEMASFLWRFQGLPVASSSAPFEDVPIDAPYGPAVDFRHTSVDLVKAALLRGVLLRIGHH